jgi:NADH-quinone oxidoreductase subunit L
MVPDFREHPGLIYVLATLLPLAAFLGILLAGALRTALRPRQAGGGGGPVYQALGGDHPRRGAAYTATLAIAGSFVCSLIGFVCFTRDYARSLGSAHAAGDNAPSLVAHQPARSPVPVHDGNTSADGFESRWSGQLRFASLPSAGTSKGTLLTLGYRIDHLNAVMFLMVSLIATLIHIFSFGYMRDELRPVVEDHQVHTEHGPLHRRGRFGRFFLYMALFCFSMLNLILADNLFQVFISWELVGVCSYLLIGFYFERRSASNAANKAFITNRVGDAGFILGLLILWTYLGTFNFEEIFRQLRAPTRDQQGHGAELAAQIVRANPVDTSDGTMGLQVANPQAGSQAILFPKTGSAVGMLHPGDVVQVDPLWREQHPGTPRYNSIPYWLLVAAGLGVFLGCVGKSAQFPLQVWLPDAMEGPTPVSALIHAATMVAAGVYLVGRCFPLFAPEARLVIAYTGGITLFLAATIAVVMTDIKKVLAYSTVSQLGYMMLALGVGGWVAGLFHLITHAFFKALLFLCSGSVIYNCHHEQEMTRMGGLYPKMKITAITMLVGVLTIAGLPLFSGWYSKDAILAQAFGFVWVHPEHMLLFALPLVTAGITTFYMFRMWFMTFTGKPRDQHVYDHAHEAPPVMTVPLIILALCSVVVAWGWPIYDAEASLLEGQLHHAQHHSVFADFGVVEGVDAAWEGGAVKPIDASERHFAHVYHSLAGNLALGLVALAILFASLIYYSGVLDPAEAQAQFPALHRFLWHKWYFDELYSVTLVRPALVVAGWCRSFDLGVIDGFVNRLALLTVKLARVDGLFDLHVIDGIVNGIADVTYGLGGRLRRVQTGYLRSYVLFMVLAAVAIFAVLSYFVTIAVAR